VVDAADRLHQFGQYASVLRDLIYDDRALDEEEFVFIDSISNLAPMKRNLRSLCHLPSENSQRYTSSPSQPDPPPASL